MNTLPHPRNQPIPYGHNYYAVPTVLTHWRPDLVPPPPPPVVYGPLNGQQHAALQWDLDTARNDRDNYRHREITTRADLVTSRNAEAIIRAQRNAFNIPASIPDEADANNVPEIKPCTNSRYKGSDYIKEVKDCKGGGQPKGFDLLRARWTCPGSKDPESKLEWVPRRMMGAGGYGCAVLWLKHDMSEGQEQLIIEVCAARIVFVTQLTRMISESLPRT